MPSWRTSAWSARPVPRRAARAARAATAAPPDNPARTTMPEADEVSDRAAARARLDDLGRLLGDAEAFSPELRRDLTDLSAELRRALDAGSMPPAEVRRLAGGAADLAEG